VQVQVNQVKAGGRGARRWIVFGVITFGGLFLVIGLILAGVSISYASSAERAQGTVVSLEWSSGHTSTSRRGGGSSGPSAHAVVEFTAADGTARRFEDSTGSSPPAYDVGERVEVLYRADSPEDARINGFVSLWLLPLIFGGTGLVITGIGTAVALVTRRRA
jgi:hypothetical protein